jgi:hypothetical protein
MPRPRPVKVMQPAPVVLAALALVAAAAPSLPGPLALPVPPVEAEMAPGVEFRCAAWSPCGELRAHAPPGTVGYRLELEADLTGGFGTSASGVTGVPDHVRPMMDGDGWSLGGFAIGGRSEHVQRVPCGEAREWSWTFGPGSGQAGGTVRVVAFEWLDEAAAPPLETDPCAPLATRA